MIDSALRTNEPDASLVSLVGKAHSFLTALTNGSYASIGELAAYLSINHADISRLLPNAFLSPRLMGDILGGKQSSSLTVSKRVRGIDLPASWQDQASVLSN